MVENSVESRLGAREQRIRKGNEKMRMEWNGREGKGREGKGREGKGREAKQKEGREMEEEEWEGKEEMRSEDKNETRRKIMGEKERTESK